MDRVAETGISAHELFLKTVAYLRQHRKVQGIITYSSGRLNRNFADVATLGAIIQDQRIKLFLVCEEQVLDGLQLVTMRPLMVCQCGLALVTRKADL